MNVEKMKLLDEIRIARDRWLRGVWVRGLAMLFAVVTAGLALAVVACRWWLELPWLVPAVLVLAACGFIYVTVVYLWKPLRRKPSLPQVARAIETRRPLEDRLVTAIDRIYTPGATDDRWLARLLRDVREKTADVVFERQLQFPKLRLWQTMLLVSLASLAVLLFNSAAWKADFDLMLKSGLTRPRPLSELEVQPGDAHIRRGSALKIKAFLKHAVEEDATIYFAESDTAWHSAPLERISSRGEYQYDFFDVEVPFSYYVKAGREISDIFQVTVFDAPSIKRIDLTYTYPDHAGLPQRYERDGGDIWAPVGTSVKVTAVTATPIVTATLLPGESAESPMQLINDTTAVGYLRVQQDASYRIRVANRENLDNAPYPEYYIHAMQDNPPTVVLKYPGRDIKAHMLEEVPVVAEIGNDFGLEHVHLAVTVNTRPEVLIPMRPSLSTALDDNDALSFRFQDYEALIYLEDLHVNIGDFVTYYVQVKDRSQQDEIKSDMFFIDIKNFENIYNIAESQGSGGGNMGEQLDLSLSQREIITATARLQRNLPKLQRSDYVDQRDKIRQAQQELKSSVEQLASMAKMQMQFSGQSEQGMIEALEAAAQEMQKAITSLAGDALDSALTAERRAYAHLVRAEMSVNERNVQMAQSSGGGHIQDADELSRLFQDELDKMKNKYETLQQGDRTQAQQAVNEALQKIKELARRQQNINEMSRQLSQRNLSEEEKKRELKKLERQQEQLRRDTQETMRRFSESLRNQQQDLSREMMNELQRASNEMRRAGNNLRQQRSGQAMSSGQQALDRLQNLEDRLRKSQQNALRDELQNMRDRMRELAEQQRRLADSTQARQTAAAGSANEPNRGRLSASEQERQAALQQQERLRRHLEDALEEMQQLGENTEVRESPELRRGLNDLLRNLQQAQAVDRMQQAGEALQQGRLKEAERLQRGAQQALEHGAQQLQRLTGGLQGSREEKLETALRETQELRDQLEQQMQAAQAGGRQQPRRDTEANSERQGGSRIGNPETADRRLTREMIEQMQETIWGATERLQQLQRQIRMDSLGYDDSGNPNNLEALTRDAINDLRGYVRTFAGGDPQRISETMEKLVDPLRRLEAELEAQLQLRKSQEALRTVREQPVPPEYRTLVEEYYRSLSKSKSR